MHLPKAPHHEPDGSGRNPEKTNGFPIGSLGDDIVEERSDEKSLRLLTFVRSDTVVNGSTVKNIIVVITAWPAIVPLQ